MSALALFFLVAQASPRAANPERPTVATHAYTVAPGYAELEQGVRAFGFGLTGLGEATAWDSGGPQWFTSLGLAHGGVGPVGVAFELFDFTEGGAGPRQRGLLGALMVTVADWAVMDGGGVYGLVDGTPDQLFFGITTNLGRIFKYGAPLTRLQGPARM